MLKSLMTYISFFFGKFVFKLIFGEKGIQVRKRIGKKNDGIHMLFIGLLFVVWIVCVLTLLFGNPAEDTLFSIFIIVGIPVIFVCWIVLAREKIKKTIEENPDILNDNYDSFVKPETLKKLYEQYGDPSKTKIDALTKAAINSDVGKLYYKLKHDKFALTSTEMSSLIQDFTSQGTRIDLISEKKYKVTFLKDDEINGILVYKPSSKKLINFSVYQPKDQPIEITVKPDMQVYYINADFTIMD